MRIGIGTYALFWEWSERVPNPISLEGMLDRTAELNCNVFQICDYPLLETFDAAHLRDIKEQATAQGIALEVGTRGTELETLEKYLQLAQALDAKVIRSMVQVGEGKPSLEESLQNIKAIVPQLEEKGIDLAFETYEQLPTTQLVELIQKVGSERVGVALDPANCVAGLEHPRDVIDRCAPYTLNLHVKDFAFSRQAGWVGFTYAGANMGEGLLDYRYELEKVQPVARGISQIVEHWLVWQGDPETTVRMEREWTKQTLQVIKAQAAK
ncbi:sugar phosphate isomerase/epimerase family protein [Arcanobacterium urinimassiliense]|uniref:sugar phosphate isomerase/epimerase family protein n=1 Tax=Arcanobacterium urinimassiliense TaxID=1871014 RepID=UPI00093BC047|nr:TIM barrel protein [Arcanobacterium urinimassiliense]